MYKVTLTIKPIDENSVEEIELTQESELLESNELATDLEFQVALAIRNTFGKPGYYHLTKLVEENTEYYDSDEVVIKLDKDLKHITFDYEFGGFGCLGDECEIVIPEDTIDCTDSAVFDELEEECWNLVMKYCDAFGIDVISKDVVSYDITKGIQGQILNHLIDAGVSFDFGNGKVNTTQEDNLINLLHMSRKALYNAPDYDDLTDDEEEMYAEIKNVEESVGNYLGI